MARKLVISAIILHLLGAGAAAESVITGTVVMADPGSGSFVLQQNGTQSMITVVTTQRQLPRKMRNGAAVKVWGEFAPRQANLFYARKIKPVGAPGIKDDPTGVRRRLNRLLKDKGFF